MPRPIATYDLSDAEKRDLIALIQQGKVLPEKYRFLLFADIRPKSPKRCLNGSSMLAATKGILWPIFSAEAARPQRSLRN